jgi:hypothetical protein
VEAEAAVAVRIRYLQNQELGRERVKQVDNRMKEQDHHLLQNEVLGRGRVKEGDVQTKVRETLLSSHSH